MGSELTPDELPLAVHAAEEVGSRIWEGAIMGVTFGILLAIYLPRFMPPEDPFSWGAAAAAVLAVAVYLFGLVVAMRARWWLRRRRTA